MILILQYFSGITHQIIEIIVYVEINLPEENMPVRHLTENY